MKKKLQNICLALVVAVILLLSATTFFEKYRGTDWAFSHVYGSVWFTVMWILLVVAALFLLLLRRVFLRPAVLCLHFSFVVILSGALLTRLTAHDGVIHLKEGIPTSDYLTGKKEKAHLPFTVTLTRFAIDYYPGTHAPSDFISEIDIRPFSGNVASYRISMNRIAVYEGWRFYQSSFDEDGRGSWLSLSRDIYGIPVTYAGFHGLAFLPARAALRGDNVVGVPKNLEQYRYFSMIVLLLYRHCPSILPVNLRGGISMETLHPSRFSRVGFSSRKSGSSSR